MNEPRRSKYAPQTQKILAGMAGRVTWVVWEQADLAGLDRATRDQILGALFKEIDDFLFEKPRPILELVK